MPNNSLCATRTIADACGLHNIIFYMNSLEKAVTSIIKNEVVERKTVALYGLPRHGLASVQCVMTRCCFASAPATSMKRLVMCLLASFAADIEQHTRKKELLTICVWIGYMMPN